MNMSPVYRFPATHGWHSARIEIGPDGRISRVLPDAATGIPALPCIPNAHSHAFQRAMAGLAEHQTDPSDSFWTWRELMYRFAGRLDPDALYAIATQLYAEMLETGYNAVCEFHYLHHQPDGRPYDDPAAMSRALIAAAADTGIRMTLLPVLYMSAGFDGRELEPRQRRFGHSLDTFMALLATLRREENPMLRIGIALHSLRAVPAAALSELMHAIGNDPAPIHIHIAEQSAEVEQCLATRGARPVQWLLDNAPVDARWSLVHATHLDEGEIAGIANSGATVALCPTTEANLGDGLFPLRAFLDAGGQISIGSDSHISVSPVEELRWLEYGQRLRAQRRNIAATAAQPSTAAALLQAVWQGGAHSTGMPLGNLAEQHAADWITLDTNAPALAAASDADLLDRFVFAGNRNLVDQVHVAGRRVVEGGRHFDTATIAPRYAATLRRLLDA